MRFLRALPLAITLASPLTVISAQALTMRECSAKFDAEKGAGTLHGQSWNAFKAARCNESVASPTAAGVTRPGKLETTGAAAEDSMNHAWYCLAFDNMSKPDHWVVSFSRVHLGKLHGMVQDVPANLMSREEDAWEKYLGRVRSSHDYKMYPCTEGPREAMEGKLQKIVGAIKGGRYVFCPRCDIDLTGW